ncbi:alpha-glucuronidase family glycosyl hydrolase [Algoriphagus sp.]|uniref:alpha-glucuronidase family glycosyl hydrolase n=1 Tax=Algoriphagus sp. TaxID=1872435 RepID=UPI00260C99C2|nr:alpha-glucuronidase family glycosyl hydrolase [Algoriphagus sp.]
MKNLFLIYLCFLGMIGPSLAHDGYKLWLDYQPIEHPELNQTVSELFSGIFFFGKNPSYQMIQNELELASQGFLNSAPTFRAERFESTKLWIGTREELSQFLGLEHQTKIKSLGAEGYWRGTIIHEGKNYYALIGNSAVATLYATFDLLKSIQSNTFDKNTEKTDFPKVKLRMLNHWDNLDRTVERGYAGFSIWDWHRLPGYVDPRYVDYARANASLGINAVSLTNVNANAWILREDFVEKVKVLADIFRPYGIQVFLTARFSAPIEMGKLETADPLDQEVQKFWKDRVAMIYKAIPDFGGFLVKANSEGQPGPHEYNRDHATGANLLADALSPHGGIVIWRAFVYSHEIDEDRHKQANLEFEPLDGKFRDNVILQVKNGAIDFQPREPFHPLFGAVENTNLGMEFQITQEYLGQATQLVYLGTMWEEILQSKTYRPTDSSTVAGIIDGSDSKQNHTLMAGVSNIGTDRNWTGHLFGQANWFAFGQLAWDPDRSAAQISEEWIKLTFGQKEGLLTQIQELMMGSHEAAVNYMTPLGLHHLMGRSHHYGPGPWVEGGRADWTSLYYHRADSLGIGFDRTASGSGALNQYASQISRVWSDPKQTPEKFLLWFHHLAWDYEMKSGNTLWEEICLHYDKGVKTARHMRDLWRALENQVDAARFSHVDQLLGIQIEEAEWWRNSSLLYFQTFANRPFPESIEKPEGELEFFKQQRFPFAPGIRPNW